MMEQIREKLDAILDSIDESALSYNTEELPLYYEAFEYIENYAVEKGLLNTALSLYAARALHDGMYRGTLIMEDGITIKRPYFCHCLAVCRMLINLHLHLTQEEEDIALSGAICHDLPAYVSAVKNEHMLNRVYHIDTAVEDMNSLIFTRDCVTEQDLDALFARVRPNKVAALIKIADRGNVVEELYNMSVWQANEYIHETRTHYIPMCIYIRERYPEMDRAVGILQEKLYDLINATEIFVSRYTDLEKEYVTQILSLEDDNARLRIRIRKMKEES